MTKVFISQPMRDKTKSEIMEERKQVVDLVENLYGKVEVADSFIEDAPANGKTTMVPGGRAWKFFLFVMSSLRPLVGILRVVVPLR
jgi:hypothetical protein